MSRSNTLPAAEAIERTVDALCELQRQRSIAFSVEVGRLVVEGIYGGDLDQLRVRHGKPHPSLRALAAHPRMPMSATALYQSIGVYRIATRLPSVLDSELTLTHLRAVLPLVPAAQGALLSQAVTNGWTARRLADEVAAVKAPQRRGGRPRLPRVVKTLNLINRLADDDGAWGDLDGLDALSVGKQRRLAAQVERLERRLRGIKLQLQQPVEAEGQPTIEDEAEPSITWRRAEDRTAKMLGADDEL